MSGNSKNTDFENLRFIGKRELQSCAEPEIRYRNADVEIGSAQANGGAKNVTGRSARLEDPSVAKRDRLAAELANLSPRTDLCATCAREFAGWPDGREDIDRYRLISKREVLQLINCCATTLWTMQREGRFPLSVRVGTRVYFHWHEIISWLAELPRSEYRSPNASEDEQSGAGR